MPASVHQTADNMEGKRSAVSLIAEALDPLKTDVNDNASEHSNPLSEKIKTDKIQAEDKGVEILGKIGKQKFGLVLQESKSSRLNKSSNAGSQESIKLNSKMNQES